MARAIPTAASRRKARSTSEDESRGTGPNFGRARTSDVTPNDVLLHRSGLYLRDIERDWRSYGDWDRIMSRIADAEPACRKARSGISRWGSDGTSERSSGE